MIFQQAKGQQRRHRGLAVLIASVAILIPGLALSGAAYATTSLAPAGPGSFVEEAFFCLERAGTLCLQANGTGEQVTITSNPADWSKFSVVRTENNPTGYQFQDGNGHCLRAGDNSVVKIENGPCVIGDPSDWWRPAKNHGLTSASFGDSMLVHGDISGFNVWHTTPISGDWTAWNYPT